MNKCEYEDCGLPSFAIEALTGAELKICEEHFKQLFGKLAKNAKIIDKTDKKL